MVDFKNLRELLPEIKEADDKFNSVLRSIDACDDEIEVEAEKYNEVLKKAVEAIYQDTKHVNSRNTIFMVFGERNKSFFTLFGHAPYNRLKTMVETGSFK